MKWVFNHRRVLGGVEFFIGNVWIARINFEQRSKTVYLVMGDNSQPFNKFGEALQEIHNQLCNAGPGTTGRINFKEPSNEPETETHRSS